MHLDRTCTLVLSAHLKLQVKLCTQKVGPLARDLSIPEAKLAYFFSCKSYYKKSFKKFTVKQEKHNAIKLLAQSKLVGIANVISQIIQGGDILSTEFHKVLQKLEQYLILKTNIRNAAKTKVRQITEKIKRRIA